MEKAEELSASLIWLLVTRSAESTQLHAYSKAETKYYPKQRKHRLGPTVMCRHMQDFKITKVTWEGTQEDGSWLAPLKSFGKVHGKVP